MSIIKRYRRYHRKPKRVLKLGAGEGNRTLISGLGSPHSTTEPHPLSLRSSAASPSARGCDSPGQSTENQDRRGVPASSSNFSHACVSVSTRLATGWQQLCEALRRDAKVVDRVTQLIFNP